MSVKSSWTQLFALVAGLVLATRAEGANFRFPADASRQPGRIGAMTFDDSCTWASVE